MDKVIVITGASAGIGEALAKRTAAKGVRVVLAARLRDAALARFGRIDVWVNNAGRGITKAVAELTDDDLDEMFRDNVKSVLYGMQAVLPHFKSRNAGQIVNVSSALARLPFAPIRSAYSAAKAAVNSLSASLRVELRGQYPGIAVSVVMPGVVATDFGLNARGGGPDSRRFPGAQPVEEAADAIIDVIDHARPEAYTQPGTPAMVLRYAQDPGAVEAEIAARFAP